MASSLVGGSSFKASLVPHSLLRALLALAINLIVPFPGPQVVSRGSSLRTGIYKIRNSLFSEHRIQTVQGKHAATGLVVNLQAPGNPDSLLSRSKLRVLLLIRSLLKSLSEIGRPQFEIFGPSRRSLQATPGSSTATPGSDSCLQIFHVQKKINKSYWLM